MSGRRWQVLGDGDFAHVPVDGVHAFRAVGEEEARFLILFVPGGPREPYFRGLAEMARRPTPPTEQEIDELARADDPGQPARLGERTRAGALDPGRARSTGVDVGPRG